MNRADRPVDERIAAAAAREPPIRAPESLLANVMEAVYRESLRGGAAQAYRLICLSFVLSAALVAAALLVPAGILPAIMRPGGVADALGAEGQSVVRNALVGADALVRGALRPQAATAPVIEGGTL